MLHRVNLNFARRSVILHVEICCFFSLLIFFLSSSTSSRPIPPHAERLIGVYYLPRPCPFFVGSLGSRSIIGFPPRKTPRFNEYYVRTRYPARGMSTAGDTNHRFRSFMRHGVVALVTSLDCRWSNQEVLPRSFSRLHITIVFRRPLAYVLAKLTSSRTITSLITPDVPPTRVISSQHFDSVAQLVLRERDGNHVVPWTT